MIFSSKLHLLIYNLALAIILCALPFSVFVVSVGLFTLTINFILEGNWSYKYTSLKNNRALWVALIIYLPVLYSFFYTTNTNYAIKELRLWLPFLLIPPVIALSKPLNKQEFKVLLALFVLSVLVGTLISTHYYFHSSNDQSLDVRQISKFISHIRFALMICLAIAILIHFTIIERVGNLSLRVGLIMVIVWLITFLFILQALTGFVMLFLLVALGFTWYYYKSSGTIKRFVLLTFGLSFLFILISIFMHKVDRFYTRNLIDVKNLPEKTQNGNPYQHDTLRLVYENGNLLYINICYSELTNEWNKRSKSNFDGQTKNGQPISQTLIRYLTSLGLTKDSVGVSKLDTLDVALIESGATSILYKNKGFGLDLKLYQILWELESYRNEGSIGHSSIVQRLTYIKSALYAIKKNLWLGVGWGDIMSSLNTYYEEYNINLSPELRYMPHNQYLTVWVGAGLIGLILFLVAMFYPFLSTKKHKHFLPLYFFVLIMVSMLIEDTFETHIGISFAAIFSSLFIFGYSFSTSNNDPESIKG